MIALLLAKLCCILSTLDGRLVGDGYNFSLLLFWAFQIGIDVASTRAGVTSFPLHLFLLRFFVGFSTYCGRLNNACVQQSADFRRALLCYLALTGPRIECFCLLAALQRRRWNRGDDDGLQTLLWI